MRVQGICVHLTGHCETTEPHKLQFLDALPYPISPWRATLERSFTAGMECATDLSLRHNFIDLFSWLQESASDSQL